ncbi:uncharacterized protein EI90DRAFT_2913004 [Cantharellus anzutake]|uniref:uncharacterized protein n=1 Tax=Cantharellus anzutake TaxID=1750568 RepID=UPI0019051F41|nr:uncharacterized protein EI90DRAFT_2913004 [Cantharellus anzutake]KAF8335957.1 hypothetical protein EI90DRAFT_2913004 [Cantharellus anzutake]
MTLYALERQVAISAVTRACALTSSVFNKLVKSETLTKEDKSPVTIADLSAQALINTILGTSFPDDPIVGEEDSSDLRGGGEAQRVMRERITELANDALTKPLSGEEKKEWGLGDAKSTSELLDAIDRGNHAGGNKGRMWAVDPIDGTKGFLRGEQYAVCLALLVNARVEVGVIGCPNLPLTSTALPSSALPPTERGAIFVAVRGQGAESRHLSNAWTSPGTQLRLFSPSGAGILGSGLRFLESVDSGHSAHDFNERVAKLLGVTNLPNRMDSQAKYCVLARGLEGEGNVYLRMPVKGKNYKEKIWDHASGNLLIHEAGGIVSDSYGRPLSFSDGRTFKETTGVVATGSKGIHEIVIQAIQKVIELEEAEAKDVTEKL